MGTKKISLDRQKKAHAGKGKTWVTDSYLKLSNGFQIISNIAFKTPSWDCLTMVVPDFGPVVFQETVS